MTFDIDFTRERTCFGIHGMGYGANIGYPIDIQKSISRAIGRQFDVCDDHLTTSEVHEAVNRLSHKFDAYLRKAYTVQKIFPISSNLDRLREDNVKDNLFITQRLLLLLSMAALLEKHVTFQ